MQKMPTSGPATARRRRQLTRAVKESLRERSNQTVPAQPPRQRPHRPQRHRPGLPRAHQPPRSPQPQRPGATRRAAPRHITGILDRLERGGWVARERDPSDRRAVVVRALRDRNAELFRLYAGMNTAMDQLCASYGDDELQLLADFLHRTTNAGRTATDQLASD